MRLSPSPTCRRQCCTRNYIYSAWHTSPPLWCNQAPQWFLAQDTMYTVRFSSVEWNNRDDVNLTSSLSEKLKAELIVGLSKRSHDSDAARQRKLSTYICKRKTGPDSVPGRVARSWAHRSWWLLPVIGEVSVRVRGLWLGGILPVPKITTMMT